MKHPPSKEQLEIFNVIETDNKNVLISAVAGSGKTTTLLMLLERIPKEKSILFMAYNRSIAEELKSRIPKECTNVEVMTVHGYGRRILSNAGIENLNRYKYEGIFNDIINTIIKKDKELLKKYAFDRNQKSYVTKIAKIYEKSGQVEPEFSLGEFKKNVINLCRNGRLELVDTLNKINGIHELQKISEHHGYEEIYGDCEAAWYLIKLGLDYTKEMDYTDMITLPIRLNLRQQKYDFVLIDECQDINLCQRILMLGAMKPDTGRFVAVGDEKQAIYGFAGADAESFRKIREQENVIELPLSVTYRCPKQVVETIQHLNPLIKHNDGNDKGVIVPNFEVNNLKTGDMVLCRLTKPLVSLCIKLIKGSKKAYLMGTDIGGSMVSLIKDKKKQKEEYTMTNVYGRLYKDLEKIAKNLMTKNSLSHEEAMKDDSYVSLKERIECIEIIGDDEENPDLVIEKIHDLFTDDKGPGICLSTVHKSKGLEAERVIILNPHLMPSNKARSEWQVEQEHNLIYVAHTRAKNTLGFIHNYESNHVSRENAASLIKESEYVGTIGERKKLELIITNIRKVKTQYNDNTTVNDLIDRNGNSFTIFGNIDTDVLLNDEKITAEEGDELVGYAKITSHKEFNGVKITTINRLTKY